ncbi:MAG: CoA ester lyase [Thermomicrobiales bacterium]|nr:CoA ester lyase [Thermomicrobiales bacterium]
MRTRSVLSVPGGNTRMIEKALASAADVVMLDLEDATAPAQKNAARQVVIESLLHGDWQGKPRTFRCNGLDTQWMYRDIVEVLQGTECGVDRIVVPKAADAADVRAIVVLVRQIELEFGRTTPTELDIQIETASAVVHCEAIAAADSRVAAITFGPGDFAASAGYPLAGIGLADRWDDAYPASRWHYPMSRISIAAHAAGIDAIDGPFAAFRDLDGLRTSAMNARALGFDGKWCIHPDQIVVVNDVFTPSDEEIEHARQVLRAYREATEMGVGAIAIGTEMIDAANLRMARRTLISAGEPDDLAGPEGP